MGKYAEMKAQGPLAVATGKRKRSVPDQLAWAQAHLPDECPAFVVSAAWVIAYRGEPVSIGAIRTQLEATGRLSSQLVGGAA